MYWMIDLEAVIIGLVDQGFFCNLCLMTVCTRETKDTNIKTTTSWQKKSLKDRETALNTKLKIYFLKWHWFCPKLQKNQRLYDRLHSFWT